MAVAGIAPEREDGVVLEEEELVLLQATSRARRGQGLLESPRIAIGDPAQPAGMQEPGRCLLLHRYALHVRHDTSEACTVDSRTAWRPMRRTVRAA